MLTMNSKLPCMVISYDNIWAALPAAENAAKGLIKYCHLMKML